MRPALHSKNNYQNTVPSFPPFNSHHPEKIGQGNKENYPCSYLYSESTTADDYYSKENSDFDELDDLVCGKQQKIKLEKRASEELSRKPTIDETKYKTEMCKNWEEKGRCNYGKKCKFAHGKHELVDKCLIKKDRYKSKLCNSFHSTFFCPYGQRCLFIHNQPKKPVEGEIDQTAFKKQLNMLNFESLVRSKKEAKRAQIFIQMKNKYQRELEKFHESFCRKIIEEMED